MADTPGRLSTRQAVTIEIRRLLAGPARVLGRDRAFPLVLALYHADVRLMEAEHRPTSNDVPQSELDELRIRVAKLEAEKEALTRLTALRQHFETAAELLKALSADLDPPLHGNDIPAAPEDDLPPPGHLVATSPIQTNGPPSRSLAPHEWARVDRLAA